jgi:hypothetical protein
VASTYSAGNNNAALDARTARLSNGYLRIYSGTQPAGPGTAITSQVLLAEHRYGTPAFAAAVASVATANAIAAVSVLATGVATWFRSVQSDGVTAEIDGTVGTSGANLIVGSTNYQQGADSTIASLTLTAPTAGT